MKLLVSLVLVIALCSSQCTAEEAPESGWSVAKLIEFASLYAKKAAELPKNESKVNIWLAANVFSDLQLARVSQAPNTSDATAKSRKAAKRGGVKNTRAATGASTASRKGNATGNKKLLKNKPKPPPTASNSTGRARAKGRSTSASEPGLPVSSFINGTDYDVVIDRLLRDPAGRNTTLGVARTILARAEQIKSSTNSQGSRSSEEPPVATFRNLQPTEQAVMPENPGKSALKTFVKTVVEKTSNGLNKAANFVPSPKRWLPKVKQWTQKLTG